MKTINSIIAEALNSPAKDETVITRAVNQLLGEDIEFSSGSDVAIIDDPTYGQAGLKAKCKGPSAKGSGFVDVELTNGTIVPVQSSLLLKV